MKVLTPFLKRWSMAEDQKEAQEGESSNDLPRIPEILFLLERKKAEMKEKEDAEKYRFVPVESGPAPLPSEDAPPPAQDDPEE